MTGQVSQQNSTTLVSYSKYSDVSEASTNERGRYSVSWRGLASFDAVPYGAIGTSTVKFTSRQRLLNNDIGIVWSKLSYVLNMINVDEYSPYVDIGRFVAGLNDIRRQEAYRQVFFMMKDARKDIIEALLIGLSQIDYEDVLVEEEKFVIEQLHSNDVDIQDRALDALLCWDSISNISNVSDIRFNNKYMQEELDSFIFAHRR